MSVSELSESNQNYLKAIWGLQEWSDDPVTPTKLAARVGVRVSTVSDAVRKLTQQGFLEHTPYGAVSLSRTGRVHALAMVRRHRLIETFLVEVLGYRWDQVHDEAETLEHAVSDFLIDRIDRHLEYPARDPHGDPIPRSDGTISMPEATLLSALEPGRSGRIERISDADPDLLQYFAEHGIRVGATVEARAAAPFTDALDIVVAGAAPLTLGRSATDSVWVSPIP